MNQKDIINIPDIFACNFSNKSPITVVVFDGHGGYGTDLQKRINNFYDQIGQFTGVKYNFIIVKDGKRESNHYTANLKGMAGICSNLTELGNFLFSKCFIEFKTERLLFFADSAGSAPAIVVATQIPTHSVTMFTPYLQVLGKHNQFDARSHAVWFAKEASVWIDENIKSEEQYFDQTKYIDQYLNFSFGFLTMHWSKKIYGSDLYFNHLASRYSKKVNCQIIEWDTPDGTDPHLLYKWLRKKDQLFKIMAKEIEFQHKLLYPGEVSDQGVTAASKTVSTERCGDRALTSPLNIIL